MFRETWWTGFPWRIAQSKWKSNSMCCGFTANVHVMSRNRHQYGIKFLWAASKCNFKIVSLKDCIHQNVSIVLLNKKSWGPSKSLYLARKNVFRFVRQQIRVNMLSNICIYRYQAINILTRTFFAIFGGLVIKEADSMLYEQGYSGNRD